MPQPLSSLETCPACEGTGRGAVVTVTRNGVTQEIVEPCAVCRGKGRVREIDDRFAYKELQDEPTST